MRATCAVLFAGTIVALVGCSHGESRGSTAYVSTDPKVLVVQLSDLPAGWSPVPGESLYVPLSWVLRDPWSTGFRSLISGEREAGYERSFWSPERRRVECEAAVYRSIASARKIFALRAQHFGEFVRTARMGERIGLETIGEASVGFRMTSGWMGFTVLWRYRRVLARCGALGLGPISLHEVIMLARLQQLRMTGALG